MSISAREMLLIIRARDLASRELTQVGRGLEVMGKKGMDQGQRLMGLSAMLTTIGIGFTAAGVVGLKFYYDSVQAATEYNQQAALTLTQVDKMGVKLEDIKDIGRDVAAAIPAPFEEMQGALYDIFSSMDVTVNESRILLTEFAKAAVAGQVEVQNASDATIGIMNAWGMKVEEVTHVNDVMFQLVRKGRGTYEQFASTIGRAVPSAVRAGQSVETLAGMLAFMTRNGMSAAMSSSAAARALDSFSNPKVLARLEKMGVHVKDAHGEFLPLVDVVDQMRDKMGNLTAPERAKALQELFLGAGGTIQARRFWDMAIANFDEFDKRVGEMGNAKGAMQEAYDIMFEQPQSQMQLMKNNWEILQTQIGDAVIPIFLKLIKVGMGIMDWWNKLSPGMKDMLIKFGLVASVVMTVIGVIMLLVGAFVGFLALLNFAGIAFLPFIAGMAAVIAVAALVAGAVYLIWKNWDKIKPMLLGWWEDIKAAWDAAWAWIDSKIGTFVSQMRQKIIDNFNQIAEMVGPALERIRYYIQAWVDHVIAMFRLFIDFVQMMWNMWGDNLLSWAQRVWDGIKQVISGAIDIIAGWIKFVLAMISGDWSAAWDAIKQIASGVWNYLIGIAKILWASLSTLFAAGAEVLRNLWSSLWSWVRGKLSEAWNAIKLVVAAGVATLISFMQSLPGKIISAVGNLAILLVSKGRDIIDGLQNGIKTAWSHLYNFVTTLPGKILQAIGSVGSMLYQKGKDIIEGLLRGLKSKLGDVKDIAGEIAGAVKDGMSGFLFGSPSKLMFKYGNWVTEGFIDGMAKQVPKANMMLNNMQSANINGDKSINTWGTGTSANSGGTTIMIEKDAIHVSVGTEAQVQETKDAVQEAFEELIQELTRSS
jgi:TP901 family phage tail tape measure protein